MRTDDFAGGLLSGRDAALDGLRGVAVLAVLYVHYVFYTGLIARPGGGHVGVLVFFVLSGYLITRILWGDGSSERVVPYRQFVVRRIKRLYPAMVGLAAIGAPVMAFFGPESARFAAESALMGLGQATAFVYASGHYVLEPWLPTWSLTVEWVFYLTWPVIIGLLRRREISAESSRRFCFALAAVLYLTALPLSPAQFYVLPLANYGVMVIGAAVALTHVQRREGRFEGRDPQIADLAFVLLLVIVFMPSSTTGHPLYRVTLFPAAVVAACIIMDQRPGTRSVVNSLLTSRPMRLLGLTSYSIYLWHIPVLWVAWWTLHESVPAGLLVAVALTTLAPVVYLSFRYLERPWLRHHGRQSSAVPAIEAADAPSAQALS